MPIVDVIKTWSDDAASAQEQGREITVGYTVKVDREHTAEYVRVSGQIPQRGDTHPESSGHICSDVTVTRKSPRLFEAICRYMIDDSAPAGGGGAADPLMEPPVITWGHIESREAVSRDLFDEPIMNTCRERFEPSPTAPITDDTYSVARNEATYKSRNKAFYKNTINGNAFGTFAALTAWMVSIDATQQWRNGKSYFRVVYTIQHRADGWKLRLLNQGFRYYLNLHGDFLFDENGNKQFAAWWLTQPVLLDKDGFRLGENAEPIWLEWDLIRPADWGVLKLPKPT